MKPLPRLSLQVTAAVATSLAVALFAAHAVRGAPSNALAPPDSFASITDVSARSAAIFGELGKVLQSPRCLNCHPSGDRPSQGDTMRPHQPPVFRGVDGGGLEAMRCTTCHQKENFDPARMPGHAPWLLAPREMGWQGRTLGEICVQMRDPARNGGKSHEDLIHHIGDDTLVGWGWHPGYGRTPVPGTQAEAKALVTAWVETGAVCPD